MSHASSPRFVAAPSLLVGASIILLALSLLFGLLNMSKFRGLRSELSISLSEKESAIHLRSASEKKLKIREKEFSDATSKMSAAEEKMRTAEAELAKTQNEKAELQVTLQASESQIADLQKRIAEATVGGSTPGEAVAPSDLKSQLEEARRQVEAAEQEKTVLAEKVKAAQDRISAMEEEKKRRQAAANARGLHGTVLAVNQAYNFVVLSIGDRQGVVPNSEMLVMRAGELIGKIRISSVEPTTSIGDIISSSLARGVQVQLGDTVIYAGKTTS